MTSRLPKMITCLSCAHAILNLPAFDSLDDNNCAIVYPKEVIDVIEREFACSFNHTQTNLLFYAITECVEQTTRECSVFVLAHSLFHLMEDS